MPFTDPPSILDLVPTAPVSSARDPYTTSSGVEYAGNRSHDGALSLVLASSLTDAPA